MNACNKQTLAYHNNPKNKKKRHLASTTQRVIEHKDTTRDLLVLVVWVIYKRRENTAQQNEIMRLEVNITV
jgi:hypothetical protein